MYVCDYVSSCALNHAEPERAVYPWNWCYTQLWAAMLGTEPGSLEQSVLLTLNAWTISPAPYWVVVHWKGVPQLVHFPLEDKWLVFSLGTITNKTFEYLYIAFFFFKWFIPFHVLVFCLHVYSMCGWCKQVDIGQWSNGSLGSGITDGCEPLYGC